MIFNSVLIDPKWVSDGIPDQMFNDILRVLSGTNPFKTVAHNWEAFCLIDGHSFFEVSQRFIEESLYQIDGLVLVIGKKLNGCMPVTAHVHGANDAFMFTGL